MFDAGDLLKEILTTAWLFLKPVWPYLLAIVALGVIADIFFAKKKKKYLYDRKDYVMTRSEREFFNALVAAVGEKYWVFPQIHLDALFEHKIRGQGWWGAFRHINEKSVDFVLCDKQTLKTVLAIELDDSSHYRSDRRERDRMVEGICRDAGLPLLRLKSGDIANLRDLIVGGGMI